MWRRSVMGDRIVSEFWDDDFWFPRIKEYLYQVSYSLNQFEKFSYCSYCSLCLKAKNRWAKNFHGSGPSFSFFSVQKPCPYQIWTWSDHFPIFPIVLLFSIVLLFYRAKITTKILGFPTDILLLSDDMVSAHKVSYECLIIDFSISK